jgi:hypothetical protein
VLALLAPASKLSYDSIYAATVMIELTISDNFNNSVLMNISDNVDFRKPGRENGDRTVKKDDLKRELIKKHREEVEFLMVFYQELKRMKEEMWKGRFKELESSIASYEQELYENDTLIDQLQNELETHKFKTMEARIQ